MRPADPARLPVKRLTCLDAHGDGRRDAVERCRVVIAQTRVAKFSAKAAARRPGEMTMLSIGKLAAGQAKYYLDQAQVRVDVVQSVGSGVEDYYVGPGEARGRWLGVAARELELNGDVRPEQLRRVLEGVEPRDGSGLRAASSRARVAGF